MLFGALSVAMSAARSSASFLRIRSLALSRIHMNFLIISTCQPCQLLVARIVCLSV